MVRTMFGRPPRRPLLVSGIDCPSPKSRSRRILRIVAWSALSLAPAYAVLHAFPQVLFAHSISERGITLYSVRPIPAGAAEQLAKARNLIDRCELSVPGRRERIFLCGSPRLFRLFAPLSGGSFAVSMPLTDHIFVAAADLGADVAYSRARVYNSRSFSGLVAHEVCHGLVRRRVGLWRASRLSTWIAEGYCDYVAGGGSFPEEEGRRLLAAGVTHPAPAFRYFLYRRDVARLLEEEGLTFDDLTRLVGRPVDR